MSFGNGQKSKIIQLYQYFTNRSCAHTLLQERSMRTLRLSFILAALVIFLSSPHALAEVELFVWQAAPDSPRILMARTQDESPMDAIGRYVSLVRATPDLQRLIPPSGFDLRGGRIAPLPRPGSSSQTLTGIIANQLIDLVPEKATSPARIRWILRAFQTQGANAFVIPVAADLGLSTEDAEDFRAQIVERLDLLVSIGGEDIDPELYGQLRTEFVRDVSPTRDRAELSLVRRFKAAAKGVFFGICRGHQMGAIADGHELHQDISLQPNGKTEEHVHAHGETLGEKQTWHHILIEKGSLLARFLRRYITDERIVLVNSVHHQVVKITPTGRSHPTATHDTSGVEALQADNGLSVSNQFHLEFPEEVSGNAEFSRMGLEFIRGIIGYARLNRMNSAKPGMCSTLFGR